MIISKGHHIVPAASWLTADSYTCI